jgi:nicotinate-nucleotide adenylyltransferase
MAKIGILGGTFDPIHKGHLLLGKQAYLEYGLDMIWYMPSGQPPHKTDHWITEAKDRCAMVNLAVQDIPYFCLSEFETSREGNTYTAQTLGLLKKEYPKQEFFFILGADSLYEIERWYHPEQILSSVKILAAKREYPKEHLTMDQQIDYLKRKYSCDIQKLHCEEMELSSKEIRQKVREGISISDLVPREVEEYILSHHLYQEVSE